MTEPTSDTPKDQNPQLVQAAPTKRFFVDMLTRDIDLDDAILDLLDNCVDGVLRSRGDERKPSEKPYDGYWAKISLSKTEFTIEDNCGGIPRVTAQTYAFRMGKPVGEQEEKLPTVGLYGIGMKRAIFKMGHSATVLSRAASDAFRVSIPRDWLLDDKTWNLALSDVTPDGTRGTKIIVTELREGIGENFAEPQGFIAELKRKLGTHYSVIIHKGFTVELNGERVAPAPLHFLMARDLTSNKIAPYAYRANIGDVQVRLVVGFHRPTPSEDELDEEQEVRRTRDTAGWTVICNDRVVVYCDKTRLTGWGEATVPGFHSQFIGITGIVEFKSNNVSSLPVTTTKRGLNTSSDLYLRVKDHMREGTKHFTAYTHKWKIDPTGERVHSSSQATESVTFDEVLDKLPSKSWKPTAKKGEDGQKFVPELPQPPPRKEEKIIRFSRPIKAIEKVAQFLTGDPDTAPSEVGSKAFDFVHKEAKR